MPFNVRMFFRDGDPEGIRQIEKSNWTGIGIVFPRSRFSEARKLDALSGAGIYILEGPSEDSSLPRVYVGEGVPLLARIVSHGQNKEFWTRAVAFTSKDTNLHKAHVQYLESRLLQLARDAKRCELDNGNAPALPPLSDADASEVETFLLDVLLCLPILGITAFEQAAAVSAPTSALHASGKGVHATGFESPQGFVVEEGSQATGSEVPSIAPRISELRQTLLQNGVLVPNDADLEFTQDYIFGSPSTATDVVLGRSTNGRIEWRDASGRTLKELQEAEMAG